MDLSNNLKKTAEKLLGKYHEDWWVRDLTNSYPWLKGNEIYWIVDGDSGKSVMIINDNNDEWICLNCPEGINPISKIINIYLGGSKWIDFLSTYEFCRLLMELYKNPQGYICSNRFLQEEEEVLDTFLGGSEATLDALRSSCIEPKYELSGEGKWHLQYNILNENGGIDQWDVLGNYIKFEIISINIKPILPNGSYYFPDEY